LQHLVENAIKHGLRTQAKGGSVLIKVIEEDERFVLTVQDNGKGIDPEVRGKLLVLGANGDSVGLANIHQRLQTRYGDVSGLVIDSALGEGTNVTFVIPSDSIEEASV
jgi:two-component system LytT family sensor kinase